MNKPAGIAMQSVFSMKGNRLYRFFLGGMGFLFLYLIVRQVEWSDLDLSTELLPTYSELDRWIYFFLILFLIPLNYGLEYLKWKFLMPPSGKILNWTLVKGILSGTASAMVTPNRIGEFGGRLLFVRNDQKWQATKSTFLGHIAQWIVLLGFGMAGALKFGMDHLGLEYLELGISLAIGLIPLVFIITLYFSHTHLIRFVLLTVKKWHLSGRIRKWKEALMRIPLTKTDPKRLWLVLYLSGLRYMVYGLQYFLILMFFNINLSPIEGLTGIATIYLIQTSIPLPAFTGLLFRTNLAVYIWEFYGAESVLVLAATFSLWFLNLLLPAIMGALFTIDASFNPPDELLEPTAKERKIHVNANNSA